MTEKPILFSAPMVRAILAGQKTQTRRALKYQAQPPYTVGADNGVAFARLDSPVVRWEIEKSRYGAPGDRLWVRETWAAVHFSIDSETGHADDWCESKTIPEAPKPGSNYWTIVRRADGHADHIDDRGWKWRPSIFMPRWASRITLEIKSVRVERLNDISEADAMAEGIFAHHGGNFQQAEGVGPFTEGARLAYRWLWESINGPDSWESNPWVWCLEFERVAQ